MNPQPVAELPVVPEEDEVVTDPEEEVLSFQVEGCPHCGQHEDECGCYDYDWGEAQAGDFPAEEEDDEYDDSYDDFLVAEIDNMKLDGTYYLLAMSGY